MKEKILVVEDEEILARSIGKFLTQRGFSVEIAGDGVEALDLLKEKSFDAVASDIMMPRCDGIELLRRMREEGCTEPTVVMSAHGTFDSVLSAMKLGAMDFLKKPIDLEELETVLRRSMDNAHMRHELSYLRRRETGDGVLAPVGQSQEMQAVIAQINNLASAAQKLEPGDTPPILITGETGTGKSLLARYYHHLVAAEESPFIEVNCTNLQLGLIASELFGHERGAFTDAKKSHRGLFEAAEGGTLYLDEIGHLRPDIQGNLLAAIEERVIRRVGGTDSRRVNVRIVATTNADLRAAIEAGEFRSDLYYRLATFHVHLPSLRERRQDVLELADTFIKQLGAKYAGRPCTIVPQALEQLQAYEWPGNVRELRNLLERAVVLAGDGVIRPSHLPGMQETPNAGEGHISGNQGSLSMISLPDDGIDFDMLEAHLIDQALSMAHGNITQASRLLGMTRSRFRSRLKRRRSRASLHENQERDHFPA